MTSLPPARLSQSGRLPRQLIVGLLSLGFGAVFGVGGMFAMKYDSSIGMTLLSLGVVSGVTGVLLVMKHSGDPRFAPHPAVTPPSSNDRPLP
jgi:hypothetical protein